MPHGCVCGNGTKQELYTIIIIIHYSQLSSTAHTKNKAEAWNFISY